MSESERARSLALTCLEQTMTVAEAQRFLTRCGFDDVAETVAWAVEERKRRAGAPTLFAKEKR